VKTIICIVALIWFSALAAPATEETFHAAQLAYDDGRYAEAALHYETLLNDGMANTAVHYNLANACFKNGNLPKAVWHYRTAWYASPRDPGIRANLHFALNAAGAVEPMPGVVARALESLSRNEWLMAAVGGYIVFTLLLLLGMLVPAIKRTLFKVSLLPALLILLSAGGWWHWQQLRNNPEWVVTRSGATALFGPMEDSTPHYKLPMAALVRQQGTNTKGWVEVEYDGKKGWVKLEYISRLSP
jgi:hypothetical protein